MAPVLLTEAPPPRYKGWGLSLFCELLGSSLIGGSTIAAAASTRENVRMMGAIDMMDGGSSLLDGTINHIDGSNFFFSRLKCINFFFFRTLIKYLTRFFLISLFFFS